MHQSYKSASELVFPRVFSNGYINSTGALVLTLVLPYFRLVTKNDKCIKKICLNLVALIQNPMFLGLGTLFFQSLILTLIIISSK